MEGLVVRFHESRFDRPAESAHSKEWAIHGPNVEFRALGLLLVTLCRPDSGLSRGGPRRAHGISSTFTSDDDGFITKLTASAICTP